MWAFQQAQHDLALRYGTELPKPPKINLALPAFSVGSCSTMLFSPSGQHLLVPTSNGCFLWEVATGKKLHRLKGPTNPGNFAFSPDGTELLMRNEQSQFARFAIPTGELLAQFRAKHDLRMEGTGCLGPDQTTVLQLSYGGVLLVLDASSGAVMDQHQLEPSGYSGEIYWLPDRSEFLIAQTSVKTRQSLGAPCALWRWAYPFRTRTPEHIPGRWTDLSKKLLPWLRAGATESGGPERVPGRWIGLQTALLANRERLLMHHQLEPGCEDEFVIDVVDPATMQAAVRIRCGGSIISHPTVSHDGKAWAATTNAGIQMGLAGEEILIPTSARGAHFHPSQDLVAIPGEEGFVAPRAELPLLLHTLQLHKDQRELTQRGYTRMTTLPDRKMPPRIVVFAGPRGWVVQAEMSEGRHYRPLDQATNLAPDVGPLDRSATLEATLRRSRLGEGALEPGLADERRHFLGGNVTPPTPGWISGVAVTFADDAIDLWPLKPSGESEFKHTWYPVAAVAPGTRGEELVRAVDRMLREFRPRKLNQPNGAFASPTAAAPPDTNNAETPQTRP